MPLYTTETVTALVVSETSTPTTVGLTASPAKLADANPARRGLTIYNPLSSTVYVDYDNGVSDSIHAFPLPPKGYFEMPVPIYIGEVWGVLATGTGNVEVRELT